MNSFDIEKSFDICAELTGWTRATVAKEMGVDRAYLTRLIKSGASLSMRNLAHMVAVMGVSLVEFFDVYKNTETVIKLMRRLPMVDRDMSDSDIEENALWWTGNHILVKYEGKLYQTTRLIDVINIKELRV